MNKAAHPARRRRHLLELRVNSWPQPTGQTAIPRQWLRWICDDLLKGLSADRWTRKPPYRPPGVATQRKRKASSAPATVSPYCWIESLVYGTCYINGVEVPCCIEHWECDDGTSYDREVPLEAALKAMKLAPPAGDHAGTGA
jgi:hypothetical protein